MSSEENNDVADYKIMAESLKDEGNAAYQLGTEEGVKRSIECYSQAIDLDPDNHVYYSNRSAAYLKSDSKSKALYDAEKCVELAPQWAKGYSRLGAAQQALKRFEPAIDSFKKAIELDSNNKTLWAALRGCQEAKEADKKIRFAAAATERAIEEAQLKLREEAKERQRKAMSEEDVLLSSFLSNVVGENKENDSHPSKKADEDVLSSFLSDVNNTATDSSAGLDKQKLVSDKYASQDLGDAKSQYERLMAPHYEWRNLNPYYVLQLDIDATEEDIRFRYKKLSTRVHPDKLRDMENAREAFEQVKTAYQKLQEEDQKKTIIMNIEHVRKEVAKDRRRLISKGVKESDQPPLEEELERRTMKHFADMEMQKKRSEHMLRFYNAREKMIEDEAKAKELTTEEFEKQWAEVERREKRVGNWRDFQVAPEAKKAKAASYKEEKREEDKFGKVQMNEWRKSWK